MGLKTWEMFVPDRIDWNAERDRIDLAAVATRLLGPAPGRRGERGRKLWWACPFHEDANPSFCIVPGKAWWRCYGCGAKGDAPSLVMRLEGMTFPEAVAYLTGNTALSGKTRPAPRPEAKPEAAPPRPGGMTPEATLTLVTEVAARLWSPEGSDALAYLTGPGRCLAPETIRAARLGVVIEPLDMPGRPRGIVIPWWVGSVPTLVKVRQPEGRKPKYLEEYRDRERHSGLYPGPEAIRPGRPLVIVEGEFDALCLGQALGELAAVVTLGSASGRPTPAILGRMLAAWPWLVATDRDDAGDKAAAGWPAPARRVPPSEPYKDWTEAEAGGVDLRRWWGGILAGVVRPPLFTWDELAAWRWGPASGDPTPGLIVPYVTGTSRGAHAQWGRTR